MSFEEQRNQEVKKFMEKFLGQVKDVFLQNKKRVEEINYKNGGSSSKK
jgi:hypothetical protein